MQLLLVQNARYLRDYIIELTFNTGEVKIVDLSSHLGKPIFKPLKDPTYFKSFQLSPFTIEWENGADFAPTYLYRLAKEQELANHITYS